MFTGIIQAKGKISGIEKISGDKRFSVISDEMDFSDINIGQSIAVNGVCLTIVEFIDQGFKADISRETLSCTTLGQFFVGTRINLEKSLQLSGGLDGHMVSGHVDGIAYIVNQESDGRSERYEIKIPDNLLKYICIKGSIAIDGVSLTVNDIKKSHVFINIIEHTLKNTIFQDYKEGTTVNLEVDLIARYLETLTGKTK